MRIKMENIFTRCGYRCDLCLAYKPNVTSHPENQQKLSYGWHKYFGFRIPPDEICCDGCLAEEPQLIDSGCPVRPCVIEKGLNNCSECDQYICHKLEQRLVEYAEIKSKLGVEIPVDDNRSFIRPYENYRRLENLKASMD
jgi:hypothetical protein